MLNYSCFCCVSWLMALFETHPTCALKSNSCKEIQFSFSLLFSLKNNHILVRSTLKFELKARRRKKGRRKKAEFNFFLYGTIAFKEFKQKWCNLFARCFCVFLRKCRTVCSGEIAAFINRRRNRRGG